MHHETFPSKIDLFVKAWSNHCDFVSAVTKSGYELFYVNALTIM